LGKAWSLPLEWSPMGQGWELTIWCSVTGSNCARPRLDANIRIVRKGVKVTNALAYSDAESITAIKDVIVLGPIFK
jgi:hypothetical protein